MTPVARRLLDVSGLGKTFADSPALDRVALGVDAGEILAVVGQNGSGKSTLVKLLAGIHEPDPGATIDSHAGLHFIHQDLGLVATLSTVENLDLGRPLALSGALLPRRRDEEHHARELIGQFGVSFDVGAPMGELTGAHRTIVAIVRALDRWTGDDHVLVLDEPTAALHRDEVQTLFAAVREVARRGAGVIFISHRLGEILELADRVIALRDGRVVGDVAATELDHDALVRLIAGREIAAPGLRREHSSGEARLEVCGLSGPTLLAVSFDVHAGEIVGVTGILGSGREQLVGMLFGALPRSGGEVSVGRRTVPAGDPRAALRLGMGCVPADRRHEGAVMSMNVRENLTLPKLRPLRRALGRLDRHAERADADRWARTVTLRPHEVEGQLRLFSGGNQQKVVLAKWLRTEPHVLLLDEPTQGVDVAAKAAIHELLLDAASAGAAVLVASTDTKELTAICNRVLVLRDGAIVAEISGPSLTEARLVRESLGVAGEECAGCLTRAR